MTTTADAGALRSATTLELHEAVRASMTLLGRPERAGEDEARQHTRRHLEVLRRELERRGAG